MKIQLKSTSRKYSVDLEEVASGSYTAISEALDALAKGALEAVKPGPGYIPSPESRLASKALQDLLKNKNKVQQLLEAAIDAES